MRFIYCLFLFLPACTSHVVRCDGRLQPINQPAPPVSAAPPVAADGPPARAP
jgi:hypothetical protein